MKILSKSAFDNCSSYILNNSRYLEKLIFENYFILPSSDKIVKALQMYQNKDGGYGNGLEPDFRLSYSSPMATSVALNKLSQFKDSPGALAQIKTAIAYLEDTYIDKIKGWECTTNLVNLSPHAPWWHYRGPKTTITGNPSAEILGYLIEFESYVNKLDLENLRKIYINYFLELKKFDEHELYCFIRLYNRLSDIEQTIIRNNITLGFNDLVNLDSKQWGDYVPYPLKFVTLINNNFFDVSEDVINLNLDYIVDKLSAESAYFPNWSWGAYESEWEIAKREWAGILTLDALILLKHYDRIESELS